MSHARVSRRAVAFSQHLTQRVCTDNWASIFHQALTISIFYFFLEKKSWFSIIQFAEKTFSSQHWNMRFSKSHLQGGDRVLLNNRHHSNVTKPELVGDGVAKHRKNCKCCLGHSLTVSHLPSMLWVSQFVLNSRLSLCLFLLVGHAMSPRPSDQLFERSNVSMIALQCSEDAETKALLSPWVTDKVANWAVLGSWKFKHYLYL